MSVTADSAAFFWRTHDWPPILASLRPRLGAADVALDQTDPRGRHIDLGTAVELDHQMLDMLAVLFDVLETTVQTDAVRKMDDQIAGFQLHRSWRSVCRELEIRPRRTGLR